LYISALHLAVSAALVLEKEVKGSLKQVPVYFVSEALSGSKLFNSEREKITYAEVMSSRKLHHHIEAHKILIVTNQPLHDLFHNKEASSRISKWVSELLELWQTLREEVPSSLKSSWTLS
jgi:hypothetical protein